MMLLTRMPRQRPSSSDAEAMMRAATTTVGAKSWLTTETAAAGLRPYWGNYTFFVKIRDFFKFLENY
jgi:hypothetical protein